MEKHPASPFGPRTALAALFFVATVRRVGVRIICQEILLFCDPVFFFWVKVHMNVGWTFFLDTARLMVVVAYPVGEVSLAYVNGDPSPFVVLLREDVVTILVAAEGDGKFVNKVLVTRVAFACPCTFRLVCHVASPVLFVAE